MTILCKSNIRRRKLAVDIKGLCPSRRAPLLRRKRLNPMSVKKLNELNAEVPERIALCHRCGGIPQISKRAVYIFGFWHTLISVACIGGVCECGCRRPATGKKLHPHEKVPRSRGGKLSLDNSIMVFSSCHRAKQLESYRKRLPAESTARIIRTAGKG